MPKTQIHFQKYVNKINLKTNFQKLRFQKKYIEKLTVEKYPLKIHFKNTFENTFENILSKNALSKSFCMCIFVYVVVFNIMIIDISASDELLI